MEMNDTGIDTISFGSLFSGAGGLDLGLERAGMKCVFQVENDRHCLTILDRHWPDVPKNEIRPCLGLVGGDPCPVRSLVGNIHGTSQPDMSGYFLAMAARCQPRWILRENVPAPDVVDFAAALEVLGYHCVVVEVDSAAFTGQSRRREFVAGFDQQRTLDRFVDACNVAESVEGHRAAGLQAEESLACLAARGTTMDAGRDYVYEGPERGIRVLSSAERELLQGWPSGWTGGIPESARQRLTGNGVTAPVAEWIGRRIIEAYKIGRSEK